MLSVDDVGHDEVMQHLLVIVSSLQHPKFTVGLCAEHAWWPLVCSKAEKEPIVGYSNCLPFCEQFGLPDEVVGNKKQQMHSCFMDAEHIQPTSPYTGGGFQRCYSSSFSSGSILSASKTVSFISLCTFTNAWQF